ncbi:hypothetical protein [Frankia sp. Cas3]|uniref:hypothetical protein n=1 Tax=Frankia sp. Cas3 TaxID=3073926 RepID=UPI002AD42F65|nr:hypothetical protein [Frankia sp. Cas3]
MTSPADLINWPIAYGAMLAITPPDTITDASSYTTSTGPFARHSDAIILAILTLWEHSEIVREILERTRKPAASDSDLDSLAEWLIDTSRTILALARTQAEQHMLPAATQAHPGTLALDPYLRELPLMALAADIAGIQGLAVEVHVLDPGTAGLCDLIHRRIILAPMSGAREWAHELAHLIDPAFGTRGEHAREADEYFADHLGALLLQHEPVTLAEAQPLIDETSRALAEHPRFGTHPAVTAMPEPGILGIATFLCLPLRHKTQAA